MPRGTPQLPPKPQVFTALLQTASSVFIHLDPRGEQVSVPAWFKKQPQLVLQVGLNMAVPIVDLDVGTDAVSCTLSFNRTPEFCKIPWTAIYGLVGEDGRGMIWPESVPAEVAAAAEGRAPVAPAAKERRQKLTVTRGDRPSRKKGGSEEAQKSSTSAASPKTSGGRGRLRAAGSERPREGATDKSREAATDQGQKGSKRRTGGELPAAGGQKPQGKKQLPPYLRVVK